MAIVFWKDSPISHFCRGQCRRQKTYLNDGTNDTQACESKVLKWPSFTCRIQKRVQKQRHVCYKQQRNALSTISQSKMPKEKTASTSFFW